MALEPLLEVGEERRGPVGTAPRHQAMAEAKAGHHNAEVHAELPLRVAGELEAEVALHLGDAALQKLAVVGLDRSEQRGQDATAHRSRGEREQHGHDETPHGPLGALDGDLAADGQREPAHFQYPLPPAQIGLNLLLVAEHAAREAVGGMGPGIACQRDHFLAQALVARVHLRFALLEQAHEAVLLAGSQRKAQPGPPLAAHPRGESLVLEKRVEGLDVGANRAIRAAESASVIGRCPVVAGFEQRPQERSLPAVHSSSSPLGPSGRTTLLPV